MSAWSWKSYDPAEIVLLSKYTQTLRKVFAAMYANIAALAAVVLSIEIVRLAYRFFQNFKASRSSGIPYVCLPFYPHGIIAQISAPIWRPLLALVPRSFRGTWFLLFHPSPMWEELYAPFRRKESDSILVCTPTALLLYTASADVINQVSERKGDFPKPIKPYSIIDSKSLCSLLLA